MTIDGPPPVLALVPAHLLGRRRNDPELAAASVVVVAIESPSLELPEAVDVLDWLRSPARFCLATIRGSAGPHDLSLALACDLVLMGRSATINLSVGGSQDRALPAQGAVERLVTRLGSGATWRLVLDGQPVASEDAAALGLVDEVIDEELIDERVDRFVSAAAALPRGWMSEAKAMLGAAAGPPHDADGRERLRRWERDASKRLRSPHEDDD